jgi:hypothetical protein
MMSTQSISRSTADIPSKSRLALGGAVFVAGQLGVLLIPIVAGSGLPNTAKAIITGLLLFGIPEVAIIISVAILGKKGFAYLKNIFFGYMGKFAPAEKVSSRRYRIGLVLFIIPFIFGWISPYSADFIPGYVSHPIIFSIVGDILLIVSLVLLGGEFWEKLHALFRHDAHVVIPEKSKTD